MKFLFSCALGMFSFVACAQNFKPPHLSKTAISSSGTFAYLPDDIPDKKFELSYSPDSSKVYTGDFASGNFRYSIIVVKLKEALEDNDEKDDMLTAYLDFLKQSFKIEQAAGYGHGHTLASYPSAIGIIDYWEDNAKDKWAVKGWADENTLAVLMVYGPKDYPNPATLSMYLDGFRFR